MVRSLEGDQRGDITLSASRRAEIEAWFVGRGVPQLIDDYTTERRMDARAGPYVLVWLIVGTVLWWGTRAEWPLGANLGGIVATLLTMALGLTAVRKARRHVMWWVDRRLEVLDTFSLGPLIAIPSALIEWSWQQGVSDGLNALLGIGIIYLIVGLGMAELAWWSIGRLREELSRIAGLVARTLPILLILVLFLLFAAELWEAVHLLAPAELLVVSLLMLTVAALLVYTAFRAEIHAIEAGPWAVMEPLASQTPASDLRPPTEHIAVPPLRFLQRLNLAALVLIGQLIQSAFVAILVAAFLVVFGLLVLPADLQERWIGEGVTEWAGFELLGETRVVSLELVTMAVLLGNVVGLYFTGLSITDSAYRTAHFDRMLDEVRQLTAARAFYAVAVRQHDVGEARPHPGSGPSELSG